MMPRSRSDAASSSSSVSGKMRRGLRALGRSAPIGSLRWPRRRSTDASVPTSPINAASPRPNRDRAASSAIAESPTPSLTHALPSAGTQFLLALNDLGGEPQIRFAAAAFEIVDQDRLAVGRRFRDAHIARDDGVVDFRAHELAHVGDDLAGKIV